VRVPASTSNLGSGFDTLGLAVNLYNRIRVTLVAGDGISIISPIAPEDRAAAESTLAQAVATFTKESRSGAPGLEVAFEGDIPVARGLGYSATVRLGVLAALNELTSAGWDRQKLVEMVTSLEGHPDNASPATLGGFTVSGTVGPRTRVLRFEVSPVLKIITLIPHFKVSTEKARRLLPDALSRTDAAHALNRAALITAAFAQKDYAALRGLFDDCFHQPYRAPLVPQLAAVVRAGEAAGAIGGFLSGSGSGIICLALEKPEAVAQAMQREVPDSEVRILEPDNEGHRVE